MKIFKILLSLALVTIMFTRCEKDNFMEEVPDGDLATKSAKKFDGTYTVTVENVSTPYIYFASGVQAIPEMKDAAGPALPGDTYKFSFHAGPGHKLSFATMYGWSNDGFFAPDEGGISLYSGKTPVTGDITSLVMLWDAGTEINQPPGENNPHDGANITNGMVQLMSTADAVNNYGTVDEHLTVNLEYIGNSMFTVTIENLNGTIKTPISPVVWVVHYDGQKPIFTAEQMDYGFGLENVAESGDAGTLGHYLSLNSGYVSPIAPFLWVLHKDEDHKKNDEHGKKYDYKHGRKYGDKHYKNHSENDMPIFKEGKPDYGIGLESLAETGNPEPLYISLMDEGYETGFYATRENGLGDGPLFPGQMYKFIFEGHVGQTVSFASMLGNSNDVFFSTGDKGIKLNNGKAEMDITHFFELYDAGTEPNEYPGAKIDNDEVEGGNVRKLNDGLPWPDASEVIKVTIKKN